LETLSMGQNLFEANIYLQVKSSTGNTVFYLDRRECR
jgi:hypothetical protein